MKKFFIIFGLLFSIILTGCSYNNYNSDYKKDLTPVVNTGETPKVETQLTGNIVSGKIISDGTHEIIISGNKVVYDKTFDIEIPKDLDTRKYGKKKRLDFIIDSSQKYMHIDSYDIPDWKIDKSDKEKCILGNYESHILSSNTVSKIISNQKVYITKAVRSADHERNDLDLCFVRNSIIYTISVSAYETDYAQEIINSFKFLN